MCVRAWQAEEKQKELERQEARLARKEARHSEVLALQREALIAERNANIDEAREDGKADMRTWVDGDDLVGTGVAVERTFVPT
jgi:hypothetical protein